MPPGTWRIHVTYAYSDPVNAPLGQGPGNAVDIGVFDPRGYDFPQAAGFRGWSGAARPEFYITETDATPGYLRGALFPGEWNVLLGMARLDPEGVRYDVRVTLEIDGENASPGTPLEGGSAEAVPLESGLPATAGEGVWLKGDLHCHTLHSDGANPVREGVEHALELGLDFLAVTDHNTNTHHEDLEALSHLPIVLIPGEEVTTYWGHANTWGLREWIDFRCADEDSMKAVQAYLRRREALFSINHPKCIGPPWIFKSWDGFQAMEVWQAPWRFYNWESLERWDGLLQAGERIVAVGGSDAHYVPPAEPRHPHGLAEPTTWVYARERSEWAVLDAIRAGRVYINDAPGRGAEIRLTADEDGDGRFEKMMGDSVSAGPVRFRVDVTGGLDRRLWIMAGGEAVDIIPLDSNERHVEFTLDTVGRRYVRAELRGFRGRPERGEVVWAMTNPIWVT